MFHKFFAFLNRFFFKQPKQPRTSLITPPPLQNLRQLSSGYSLDGALELTTKSVSYMLEEGLDPINPTPVFKPGYTAQDYQEIYRSNLNENLVLMDITLRKLSPGEQTRLLGICKPPAKANAQKQ